MVEFQKNNASLSFSEALLKGKDGEDGGYYKPSINNNLISWQPSKTDMPPVDDFALTLDGGAGDFIIKMMVEGAGDGDYTVISCDATVEQIDAAFNADKNIFLTVAQNDETNKYVLSLTYAMPEFGYVFGAFYDTYFLIASIDKTGDVTFATIQTPANAVDYSNAALPSISTVGDALDELVPKSHSHDNKDTLDKLSDSNGALKYNNRFIMPQKISEGTNITLADNTEYRLTDVTTLNLSYPTGNFECWMRLTFAASGNITVTLPADTEYLGATPNFKNGETWELSIKDGVVVAGKVA